MAWSTRATRSGRSTPIRVFDLATQAILLAVAATRRAVVVAGDKVQVTLQAATGLLARPAPSTTETHAQETSIVRFDRHQRIQHILMFTSFLALAFTGLPQKFHDWSVSQWFIGILGGLEMTQQIHHVAAYVMLFDCAYHAVYLFHSILIRRQITALQMIPMPKDALDAIKMFKYFLGLSNEKPQFGRFSYLEKFDYWAVFWGIAIIGGSGIILLIPVQISRLLPGGIVPVALAAHSDEAVLAVGWIFIVHFFYAHFAPAVFPFNPSIFTGRVPKHRYQEEHPLEYAKLFGSEEEPVAQPQSECSAGVKTPDPARDETELIGAAGVPPALDNESE